MGFVLQLLVFRTAVMRKRQATFCGLFLNLGEKREQKNQNKNACVLSLTLSFPQGHPPDPHKHNHM